MITLSAIQIVSRQVTLKFQQSTTNVKLGGFSSDGHAQGSAEVIKEREVLLETTRKSKWKGAHIKTRRYCSHS